MNTGLPPLSIEAIQAWVGPSSFSKGHEYFRQRAIVEPRRQGLILKASCLGSSAPSYRVEVVLDEDGIAEAECSCPVGAGGYCKHVAALLLTWLDTPQAFEESADPETILKKRSKPELIALILQMLERYPDLDFLLELPSPSSGPIKTVIHPETIQRQVSRAFAGSLDEWDWRQAGETARDLDELLSLAEKYQQQADHTNAVMIYRTVAEGILEHEMELSNNESGRLGGLVDDCVVGLDLSLEFIQDGNSRREVLCTLLDIYLWDIRMGGIGIGEEIPLTFEERTTPHEKEILAGWTRSALPGMGEWGQKILGALLLLLQAETLDDEAFLDICRQTGRLNDLVDRLLQLGRLAEAVSESEKSRDYPLLSLLDIFVKHGHGNVAENLVRQRSASSTDSRLTTWLMDYAIQQGRLPEALELASLLFWDRPSLEYYQELRTLATQTNQWAQLHSETLAKLSSQSQFELLVEIYLEEGEIDLALDTLELIKTPSHHPWYYPHSLELQVAQAAENSRPEHAIRLYLNQVRNLIDRRGRGNYAAAAGYLLVVRNLYYKLAKGQEWETLIANLRLEHRSLPALKDELNRAGL